MLVVERWGYACGGTVCVGCHVPIAVRTKLLNRGKTLLVIIATGSNTCGLSDARKLTRSTSWSETKCHSYVEWGLPVQFSSDSAECLYNVYALVRHYVMDLSSLW